MKKFKKKLKELEHRVEMIESNLVQLVHDMPIIPPEYTITYSGSDEYITVPDEDMPDIIGTGLVDAINSGCYIGPSDEDIKFNKDFVKGINNGIYDPFEGEAEWVNYGLLPLSHIDNSVITALNAHEIIDELIEEDGADRVVLVLGKGDKLDSFLKEHYKDMGHAFLYVEMLPEEAVLVDELYRLDMILMFKETKDLPIEVSKRVTQSMIDGADVYFVI